MEERIILDDIAIKKVDKDKYEAINLKTGEILDKNNSVLEEAITNQQSIDKSNKIKQNAIRVIQEKEELSINHHVNWMKSKHFIKIYRTELREYLKIAELSPHAGLLLLHLQPYIEFKTNKIHIGQVDNISNEYLEKLTNLSKKKIVLSLKELEDKKFIARVGKSQQREIYFNPYLLCSGNVVLKSVAKLFDGYERIT